jgi:hypothetical protein
MKTTAMSGGVSNLLAEDNRPAATHVAANQTATCRLAKRRIHRVQV